MSGKQTASDARSGHGWGAYLWPLVSFLVVVEIAGKLPEVAGPYLLPVKVALPLGVLIFYATRGHYSELRGYPFGLPGIVLDFAVGVAGAAVWIAPYLVFDSMRPEDPGFDPQQWGVGFAWLAVLVRGIGYGLVTPFVEEIFVRGWLIRYIAVFKSRSDFRDFPIGQFTWPSFLVVVIYFTLSHVPWEWPVAVAWVVGTTLWLYYRKNLLSLVIVHAGSNLSILLFVLFETGKWLDAEGLPIDLWFFV